MAHRIRTSTRIGAGLAAVLVAATACNRVATGSADPPAGSRPPATSAPKLPAAPATTPGGATYVYWDQNEEVEYLTPPATKVGVLVAPWDPNGQMCILPDNSGRFVTGYNPTNPDSQGSNPGSKLPFKDPPVGQALWNADGTFSGTTFYVPGPYGNTSQGGGSTNNPGVGGDLPPDKGKAGHFNNSGTFTGCAFGKDGNLFAADLGTAQGDMPPPDTGRLIMWFAPDFKAACIVLGPTEGGDGPHHVDGTGGLRNPGTLAADAEGNVYVPEAGTVDATGQAGHGRVFKVDASTLPASPADCPGEIPKKSTTVSTFISNAKQPFPLGVAIDPTCDCFAVTNVFGEVAVAWYGKDGTPIDRPPVPGKAGADGYNPFGIAFTGDGTLFFIDIHVACAATGCGPTPAGGGLYRVTFGAGKVPATPEKLAAGMNFPVSVTTCDGAKRVCPAPTKDHGAPLRPGAGKE